MDRDRLFADHIGWACGVAARVSPPRGCRWDEVRQSALIGLWRACRSFDLDKMPWADPADPAAAFRPWAARIVAFEVVEQLRAESPMPRAGYRRVRELAGSYDRLAQQLGREPTWRELEADAGVDVVSTAVAVQRVHRPTHIAHQHSDGPVLDLRDPSPGPDDHAVTGGLVDALNAATRRLPAPLEVVIELRYWQGMTLREVGDVLGITEAGVLWRERKALRTLQGLVQWERTAA